MTEAEQSKAEKTELKKDLNRGILVLIAIFGLAGSLAGGAAAVRATDARDAAREARSASREARTAAREAKAVAGDAREIIGVALNAAKDGNCRAVFAASITDARTKREDASATLLISLAGQASAALRGEDADPAAFAAAKADLEATSEPVTRANDAYQILLTAQSKDRALFDEMCRTGPPS